MSEVQSSTPATNSGPTGGTVGGYTAGGISFTAPANATICKPFVQYEITSETSSTNYVIGKDCRLTVFGTSIYTGTSLISGGSFVAEGEIAGDIRMSAGTFKLNVPSTLSGTLSMIGGSASAVDAHISGTVDVRGGTFSMESTVLSGRMFISGGSVELLSDGTFEAAKDLGVINLRGGDFKADDGSRLRGILIVSGGQAELDGDSTASISIQGGTTVFASDAKISGLTTVSDGNLEIDTAVAGDVTIQGGKAVIGENGDILGRIDVSGGSLKLTHDVNGALSLLNGGTLLVDYGPLSGASTFGKTIMVGGTNSDDAAIDLQELSYDDGHMHIENVGNQWSISNDSAETSVKLNDIRGSHSLTIEADGNGGSLLVFNPGVFIEEDVVATSDDYGPAVVDVVGGSYVVSAGTSQAGNIILAAGGVSVKGSCQGIIDASGGSLSVTGSLSNSLYVYDGAYVDLEGNARDVTMYGGNLLIEDGTFDVLNLQGGSVSTEYDKVLHGNINVSGGCFTQYNGVAGGKLTVTGGTAILKGNITNEDVDVSGGLVTFASKLNGDMTITGGVVNVSYASSSGGHKMSVSGGLLDVTGTDTCSVSLAKGGTMTVEAGGSFNADLTMSGGLLDVYGTLAPSSQSMTSGTIVLERSCTAGPLQTTGGRIVSHAILTTDVTIESGGVLQTFVDEVSNERMNDADIDKHGTFYLRKGGQWEISTPEFLTKVDNATVTDYGLFKVMYHHYKSELARLIVVGGGTATKSPTIDIDNMTYSSDATAVLTGNTLTVKSSCYEVDFTHISGVTTVGLSDDGHGGTLVTFG